MKFIVMLFMLICGWVHAATDVDLARQARILLSKPQHVAGFQEVSKCFPVKVGKGRNAKTTKKCVKELKALDVLLAIRRDGDKQFTVIEAAGSGPNLCVSKTTGFETKCYVNHLGKTNGVNTEFEVEKPSGYKVYAIRRVVNDPKGRKEVVYTPYSDKLNTPEVRQAGMRYIEKVIDRAIGELREQEVRSLIAKGSLAADLAPRDVLRRLVLIEHIDEARFRKEPFARLLNEVYTTYGLNQEIAYNYAVSSAKARGMFQVIPKTYRGIVKTYPKAKLKQDFVEGTKDHVNAAKVAALLADHDVGRIPESIRPIVVGPILSEFVSSSYNGGPARPIAIIKARGDLVANNPNDENRTYVMKMRATYKH